MSCDATGVVGVWYESSDGQTGTAGSGTAGSGAVDEAAS